MKRNLNDPDARIRALERKVKRLESGSNAQSTSVDRGRFRIGNAEFRVDEDGVFSLVGTFNQSGEYNVYDGGSFNLRTGGELNVFGGGDLNVSGDVNVRAGGNVLVEAEGMVTVAGPVPIFLRRGTVGGVDQAMIQFGSETGSNAIYIAATSAGGNPNLLLKSGAHFIQISNNGIEMSDNAGGGDPGEPGEDLGMFQWPFSLSLVTSEYGPRTFPYVGFHEGIDFAGGAASDGNPIPAAADGFVAESTFSSGWGNYVRLNHITTNGKQLSTLYAHMIEPSSLQVGDPVDKGKTLGRVGNTGNSFGSHLHFETWSDTVFGSHMNPRDFMALYGPG